MREVAILGIDPGIANNKRVAMSIVQFGASLRKIVWHSNDRVWGQFSDERITQWVRQLEFALDFHHIADRCPPVDLVAIEDASPRGRGGANLRYLVNCLKEHAKARGLRVFLINPTSVKMHAVQKGNAAPGDVAAHVRATYTGAADLPVVTGEYDLELSAAIAGAAYDLLLKEEQETRGDDDNGKS